MCGIVGFTGLSERQLLKQMNAAQFHRGPDDSGEFWDSSAQVAMAMRRLSIVDLSGGHQPMTNGAGDVVIIFNGEIFNAPDIRRDLNAKGVNFISDHSDTEVILRLYEAIGDSCAAHLNGMFAFVIYDQRQQIIYGARDPFGIKPLHIHLHSEGISWASEIKSFFGMPFFKGEIDSLAVNQYLGLQYVPGARTIYKEVMRIEPGNQFIYKLKEKQLAQQRYYELPFSEDKQSVFPDHEVIRSQFMDAVKRWNMADVPVACSLSGGIDSAAIVACLSRCGISVKTYTVGFQSPADIGLDESRYAREVAELYATDHHEIQLDLDDLLPEIPLMIRHLDEPYGGGLPSWFIFQYMAKDVKVAMTGTGGDELFSNYSKFRWLEGRSHFLKALYFSNEHARISSALASMSAFLTQAKKWRWPDDEETTIRDRHRREDASLFWSNPFGITFPTAHGSGFCERLGPGSGRGLSEGRLALEKIYKSFPELSLRNRCAAVDFRAQLPDEFLLMTDRFSMAHSLEARTPFLDKDFVEFSLGINPAIRLNSQNQKRLLRDAFRDWLPVGFTERRKKGFVLPIARWLRGPLREEAMELFAPEMLKKTGHIRHDFRELYYNKFLEGHSELAETIWTVFMFQQWHQYGKYGSI